MKKSQMETMRRRKITVIPLSVRKISRIELGYGIAHRDCLVIGKSPDLPGSLIVFVDMYHASSKLRPRECVEGEVVLILTSGGEVEPGPLWDADLRPELAEEGVK